MAKNNPRRALKLAAAAALVLSLAACGPLTNGVSSGGSHNSSSNTTGNETAESPSPSGKRTLTVVDSSEAKPNQTVTVERIHRLEGASVLNWLSDDKLTIETTKQIKPGTSTEEPQYSYTDSVVELAAGAGQDVKGTGGQSAGTTTDGMVYTKEQVSPDGKYSFIQKWSDKYTVQNSIKNLETGAVLEVKGSNYLEAGGWLNSSSYVLAAGDPAGRGEIREISTNGTVTLLDLDDPEVEIFTEFGVSQGSIFYTDRNNVLKKFKPGQNKPETVSEGVMQFRVSPNGEHVAADTFKSDRTVTELRLMNADGQEEGGSLAKGDLMPYFEWSPDSSKLALAVYNENPNGLNGVYIFDYGSGQLTLVGPGYFPEYPLSWNPSGSRLAVTIKGKNDLPVTEILDFK